MPPTPAFLRALQRRLPWLQPRGTAAAVALVAPTLQADLLTCFQAHSRQIHAVVLRRLQEGALEPVMLREAHFTLP